MNIYNYDSIYYKRKLARDFMIGLNFKRPTGLSSETAHVAMFVYALTTIIYFK